MDLDPVDAAELAETLAFIRDWLNADHTAAASLRVFVGQYCAYGSIALRTDLDRFIFLLGGDDGETLFGTEDQPST